MTAVSRSIAVDRPAKSAQAARQRLGLILVVNDVLHAGNFHQKQNATKTGVAKTLMPHISDLCELAAQAVVRNSSSQSSKIKSVLNSWAHNKIIDINDFNHLRDRVKEGFAVAQGVAPTRKRTYALPEWFGDRNAPWHEQPASYMLEHLIKHPTRPIQPKSIDATRLSHRQPSERTRQLLEDYFENIDLDYIPTGDNPTGETKKYKLWLDSMGQLVKQNKETGETKTVCNGYGWSVDLCQDMQDNDVPDTIRLARAEHHQKLQQETETRQRTTSSSNSRSHSPPYPQYQRRFSPSFRSSNSSKDNATYRGARPSSRDDSRKHESRVNNDDRERDASRWKTNDTRSSDPTQVAGQVVSVM